MADKDGGEAVRSMSLVRLDSSMAISLPATSEFLGHGSHNGDRQLAQTEVLPAARFLFSTLTSLFCEMRIAEG